MTRSIEIRSYRLKPGAKAEFHRLVSAEAIPLALQWGTDVVAYGPSSADDEGYVLIRAYADTAQLTASQDGFYASDAWRDGPRQRILDLIDEHLSVVVSADEALIEALRGMRLRLGQIDP